MMKVGLEKIDEYLDLFEGKRVGLITNPTGITKDMVSTIDILNEKTNLVALFSPEHGVRGDLQAGIKLEDYADPSTGCMVFSLYGENRKPTKKMLDTLDVLCFDIQDVGARFYTYIYTLAYAMMAAQENNKTFVIFDRPNPVGGNEVEGNILDITYRSFVGYYPLVQRYGLTIGELALYYNTEYDIHCDLHIIPMEGWKRDMDYEALKRPWVFPSPNIPYAISTYSYLTTCYFEGTNMSEGRGTAKPFSMIGAPWFNADKVIKALQVKKIVGAQFRKVFFTPTFSKHQDVLCQGIELIVTDKKAFRPVRTGMILLYLIRELHPEFDFLPPYHEGRNQMIDLLTGDNIVRTNRLSLDELLIKIEKDSKTFKQKKVGYHLYE